MMYTVNKRFEWDSKKSEANAIKHGIEFELAQFAFDDPDARIRNDEKHSSLEVRQKLIGNCGFGLLFVVFTMRGERIRIIHARRANAKERRIYAQI